MQRKVSEKNLKFKNEISLISKLVPHRGFYRNMTLAPRNPALIQSEIVLKARQIIQKELSMTDTEHDFQTEIIQKS